MLSWTNEKAVKIKSTKKARCLHLALICFNCNARTDFSSNKNSPYYVFQSRRSRALKPQLVAVCNCDEVAYGIKPQGNIYTRLRVMPYAFGDSIQCASALIPCQACGLDKKITSEPFGSDVIFFGDPSGNLNPRRATRSIFDR